MADAGEVHSDSDCIVMTDPESDASSQQSNVIDNAQKNVVDADVDVGEQMAKIESNNDSILLPEISCPRINCPEKILFVLDLCSEMNETYFRSRVGDKLSALKETKKAMRMFMMNKNRMNENHEFALAVFHQNIVLLKEFTPKPKQVVDVMEELHITSQPSQDFDLTKLFTLVEELDLPEVIGDVQVVPPPYIVRVILIYGRSHHQPSFTERQIHHKLEMSPYFFVDVLYVHQPPSEDNKCEQIFNHLCELDHKGFSYILEASTLTRLFDSFAKLLAHPLQRPLQREASYNIGPLLREEQAT